ncbi:MAG TPA: leucyl/phenylalanyl-tRNA--protein transferase [Spirochaetia bacterium]
MPSEKRGSDEPRGGSSDSVAGPRGPSGDPHDALFTRFRFPHPSTADEDGLVAVGGDLKPGTLLLAYRNGIFPWTIRPITWWSPDPRAIIPIGGLHVSRSLARYMRHVPLRISFDTAFPEVMEGCAAPRPGREKTWISPGFIRAYCELHRLGYAHSAEVWRGERLVGGLYGVSIGGLFAGESMFSAEENGSKVALVAMEGRLRASGYVLFDVQMMTPHLRTMGAVEIPRGEYLRRVREAVAVTTRFSGED